VQILPKFSARRNSCVLLGIDIAVVYGRFRKINPNVNHKTMSSHFDHITVAFDILDKVSMSCGRRTIEPNGDQEKMYMPLLIKAGFIEVDRDTGAHSLTWKGIQFHSFYSQLREDNLPENKSLYHNEFIRYFYLFH
jgi:predicted transcriptional regulator